MASPDAVLDSIDGALRDYETSADAMRWSPAPEAADAGVNAAESFQFELALLVDVDALNEFGRRLMLAFCEMTAQLGTFTAPLVKLAADIAHAEAARDRRHRIRCATCNPAGNPPPWPPQNGYDYRQRLKNRARRAR